jgi:hypothetical protein
MPVMRQEYAKLSRDFERVVQALPILGKTVCLYIKAYEYFCENPNCKQKTFVEDFDAFLSIYNRFSTRCEDFIMTFIIFCISQLPIKLLKN